MNIAKRADEIKKIQLNAIENLQIDQNIINAIDRIIMAKSANSRIITTGMGKAGIIAIKMSATLASIGLPSFFVSPAESGHGDLGRITPDDLVIVFSNSGTTAELISMINNLHKFNGKKNTIIHIGGTDKPQIPSEIIINYGKVPESCVVSKVPSTSTTLMLLIADILAITAAESLGFNDDWFKIRHPGGAIGQAYANNSK